MVSGAIALASGSADDARGGFGTVCGACDPALVLGPMGQGCRRGADDSLCGLCGHQCARGAGRGWQNLDSRRRMAWAHRVGLLVRAVAAQPAPLIAARDLWWSDEVRHGGVLLDLASKGDWWALHLNGAPYTDKRSEERRVGKEWRS